MRAGLIVLAVALVGHAACGSAQNRQAARSVWIIDTHVPIPDAMIKRGKLAFSVSLLPEEIIAISGDAVDAATKQRRASAGGIFIKMVVGEKATVFCSSKPLDSMGNDRPLLVWRYKDTFICLVDTDNDQKLDSYYEVRSGLLSELPFLPAGKVGEYLKLEPLDYRKLEPARLQPPLHLSLTWKYGIGVGDWVGMKAGISRDNVKNDVEQLDLTKAFGLAKGNVPGRFKFGPYDISLTSTEPKSAEMKVALSDRNPAVLVYGTSVFFASDAAAGARP